MRKMVLVVMIGAISGCVIFLMFGRIPPAYRTVEVTLDTESVLELSAAIEANKAEPAAQPDEGR